jgi:putative endonuclease
VKTLQDYGLAGRITQRFFYVYILVSESEPGIHYTGITRNLLDRLCKHNRGECLHSAKHRPWKIETALAFSSEKKARAFEKYLRPDQDANSRVAIFEAAIHWREHNSLSSQSPEKAP